jgi:hypothetical protein
MPFAGMEFKPLIVEFTKVCRPLAIRACQASVSPSLGAPLMPGLWQEMQASL